MDATPPNPTAALVSLKTLREQDMKDIASAEMRRRAEQLSLKERGLLAFQKGDFAGAITALALADMSDQEVKGCLREARRKEALRLSGLSRWSDALEVLEQTDITEPGFPALLSRVR